MDPYIFLNTFLELYSTNYVLTHFLLFLLFFVIICKHFPSSFNFYRQAYFCIFFTSIFSVFLEFPPVLFSSGVLSSSSSGPELSGILVFFWNREKCALLYFYNLKPPSYFSSLYYSLGSCLYL